MLKGAGVVLCTYNHSAALKLVGEGLKFDLIVLDEASQVAETLTLVLAGDHWPDLHGLFTKMRARAMVVFLSRNKRMPRNLTLPRKLNCVALVLTCLKAAKEAHAEWPGGCHS